MIRSLYSKFFIFTAVIMIGSMIIAFLVVNTFYHQYLKENNDTKNVHIAQEMAEYMATTDHIEHYLRTTANVGYKVLHVDPDGDTAFYGADFRDHNLSDDAIEQVLNGTIYHGMRDFPKETFVTGFFSDETANTVGVPVEIDGQRHAIFIRPDIKLLFTEVHYLLGGMFVAMAIVSMVAMLFIARKLVRPLTELTKATKEIGKEQFAVELPTNRHDEIGQLAESFQQMTERLDASDKMKKQFISDVSHDFQTPLQNIQGYARLLHEGNLSNEEIRLYTDIIQSETDRLSALTKQLLLLTSLDTLENDVQKENFRLDTQIKEVIQKHRWKLMEKNISLTMHLNEMTMYGHQAYMEKVWENLLSNALKYTKENGAINIDIIENDQKIIAVIKDNGIGIEQDKIPLLFDRFYRVDSARHASIEGTGLGLSIVKQVVDLHHGTIHVTSNMDQGTTFSITFPKL